MRRTVVVLLALALTSVAALLWINDRSGRRVHGDGRESHAEIGSEDREALREVLREEAAP